MHRSLDHIPCITNTLAICTGHMITCFRDTKTNIAFNSLSQSVKNLNISVLLYLLPYVQDDHQDDGQDEAGHGAAVGDPVGAALDP